MVVLLLGLIGTGLGAADLVRLRRFWTGGAWVAGGLFLTLFVPWAGLAVMGASFPLRKWVTGERLRQTADQLDRSDPRASLIQWEVERRNAPLRSLLFQIASVVRADGCIYAGGRNCGAELALGDVLVIEADGPPRALRVQQILSYGKLLNVLSPGMTGELQLIGEPGAKVEPGAHLIGESSDAPPEVAVLGEGRPHVDTV